MTCVLLPYSKNYQRFIHGHGLYTKTYGSFHGNSTMKCVCKSCALIRTGNSIAIMNDKILDTYCGRVGPELGGLVGAPLGGCVGGLPPPELRRSMMALINGYLCGPHNPAWKLSLSNVQIITPPYFWLLSQSTCDIKCYIMCRPLSISNAIK